MKKTLFVLSASILALVACNKEISEPTVIEEPVVIEQEPTILTFSSEEPQTKTAWDSGTSSIVWTTGDRIRVGYTLDGNWMGVDGPADFSSEPKVPAKFYVSNNVTINAEHANSGTFTVPTNYTNSPSGSAVFYGVYPSSSISSTDSEYAPSLTVVIPDSQTPGANTFDKAADIMVGKTAATDLTGAFPTEPLALEWDRIVAHADITFKNLKVEGDASVNKITLVFNSEAKVVGTIHLDVTNGNVSTTGSSSNEIEIQGDNLSINEGNIEAWAAVLPVTFTSVDVTVKTDLATYSRSITGISKTFKKNARNTLGINMASATKTLNSILIPDGNYVIAAENGGNYYAISSAANASSSRRDRREITTVGFDPSDYSAVSPYTADNSLIWTVTNVTGGVKINLAGDTNSYMAYGNKTLPLNSTGNIFEVTEGDATGSYNLRSTSFIYMNGTNGFGCYATAQTTKDLYFIPATGTPVLSFPITSKDVAADATDVDFTFTNIFTGAPSVVVTSDPGKMISDKDIDNGYLLVALNENTTSSPKTATLTVSASGAADVVLTINQAGVVGDANNGDTLWAESFGGFSANDVPSASNGLTTVYGSKKVTYACVNGDSDTKIYAANNAGGTSPELLISKNGGSFTVSGVPTGNATGMKLSFKANNNGCTVSATYGAGSDATVGSNIGTATAPVYGITVPVDTKTVNITFTNSSGSNTRIDDIVLVAGAPIPSITVTTNAATATATAAGTTATLNGTITLVNGADIGNVTEAGFYYKLTSAGSYSHKILDSAPATTSFSADLTGLTPDAEYTYYAYAIYDGGSAVNGETETFTPTQTGVVAGSQKEYNISSSTSNTASFNKLFGGSTNSAIIVDHVADYAITLNSDRWYVSTTGNGSQIYVSGQQLGAGKSGSTIRDITSLTMYTSAYTEGIQTVKVNTKSNGSTTLSLYINDVLIETKASNLTNSFADYTFTLASITTGTIKLVWNNATADKNICVASITIN